MHVNVDVKKVMDSPKKQSGSFNLHSDVDVKNLIPEKKEAAASPASPAKENTVPGEMIWVK